MKPYSAARDLGGQLPTISVIVPVYNARHTIEPCVGALLREAKSYKGRVEIIILDNGSDDGSYQLLLKHYSDSVHVVPSPEASIGELRNRGAHFSSGEVLCFVDADCVVTDNYFPSILSVLATGAAEATGSSYRLPDRNTWVERVWHDLHQRGGDGYVKYLNAGNFSITRDAFLAVGGFREDVPSGEDAELGQRLRLQGYRIYESHEVGAVHLGNAKTLRQFFRKQTWHAIGMLPTAGHNEVDRPLLMLILHLILATGAVLNLFLAPWSLVPRLVVAGVFLILVPATTVAYRYRKQGGGGRPIRETILYFVYYAARARGLLQALSLRSLTRPADMRRISQTFRL